MSEQRPQGPAQPIDRPGLQAGAQPPRACTPRQQGGLTECPACGEAMRLWANYHRCRNCGYKESCCF